VTSRNQGLSSNDQGRQRRETLGTRLESKYRQNIHEITSLSICKEKLKTFLFNLAYK